MSLSGIHKGMDLSSANLLTLLEYEKAMEDERKEAIEKDERRIAIHKTVDTFAGILKRRLWVKQSQVAYTDGMEIAVPINNKHAYAMAEHELAHCLFNSNFAAKKLFCDSYIKQINDALKAGGRSQLAPVQEQSIGDFVGMVLNVLEDHRVNSLWALLYPGSYVRILDAAAESLARIRKTAHSDLITFFLLVANDQPAPEGRFDRFRPAMQAALHKVVRKGPGATFVVGKWLLTQIVSELIRIGKNLPPPPSASDVRLKTDADQNSDKKGKRKKGKSPGKQRQQAGTGDNSATEARGQQEILAGGDGQDGGSPGSSGEGWIPPSVEASSEERINALHDLIGHSRRNNPDANSSMERLEDVRKPHHGAVANELAAKAPALVREALHTQVHSPGDLDRYLAHSENAARENVAQVQEELRKARDMDEKQWIARDVNATTSFKDITRATAIPTEMTGEDSRTAHRLQQTFQRVKSRRAKVLSDSGFEVDVEAYIANRTSRMGNPMFKTEGSGRGFKVLILVDRSSSMRGSRSDATERAARILRRSLKLPNVEFNVWGFQAEADYKVLLSRIDPSVDVQDCAEMPVGGTTPIHIATKVAVNWLSQGTEKKQLIILTDGMPCFAASRMTEQQMMEGVSKDIRRARRQGINVTSVVFGREISDTSARLMFGERNHWIRVMRPEDLTSKLIRVVSSSFMNFLSN